VGDAAAQLRNPPQGLNIEDCSPDLKDIAETAALIENLDLLITIDTMAAHLAGAMGKAVWVLLPFIPDWRWLLDRNDSPWYPSMKLFRQARADDWSAPVKHVVESLSSISPG
jgi:ADP-heptose:LPS heptosyltransferase